MGRNTKHSSGMVANNIILVHSTPKNKLAWPTIDSSLTKVPKEISFTLNYPNMSDHEREEALKVEPPVQKKRGKPNPTTGLIGVFESGKRFQAFLTFSGTRNNLGFFDTKKQAGMAYDRFVIDKSTEEFTFLLNYPHGLPTSGTKKV